MAKFQSNIERKRPRENVGRKREPLGAAETKGKKKDKEGVRRGLQTQKRGNKYK